jgi:thiosulfate reductase cytochrome b subunit
MSPAMVLVVPALLEVLGGQQSARTIHSLVANLLLVFLLVHIALVCLAGFTKRMRAMITGYSVARGEHI